MYLYENKQLVYCGITSGLVYLDLGRMNDSPVVKHDYVIPNRTSYFSDVD